MEDQIIKKIYRLFGAGMNYYGSTHQPLYERKSTHKSHHKNKHMCCSSKIILDACDDWDLEIVEILSPNISKEDILLREKWWIDNNECVNINSPIQTTEDLKEYKRKWAEQNRRAKGVQPKTKKTDVERKNHQAERMREKRAAMNDEEREEINKKKREVYDNEKQKEYVNRPDVKAKRLEDQQKKRDAIKLFKNLPFNDII